MVQQKRCWLLLLLWGLVPLTTFGQVVEEENDEVIQASGTENKTAQKPKEVPAAASQVVESTNAFRHKHDLSTVKVDDQLTSAAQYFANYMAEENKYGHTADGKKPSQRAQEHGYEYCLVSENIAYLYRSPEFPVAEMAEHFVTGWINSPDHRENMLDPDVSEIGVAVSQSASTGYYFAVQMFARPKSQQIEFTVENNSTATIEYQAGEQKLTLPPRYRRMHHICRPSELKFYKEVSADDKEPDVIDQHKVEPRATYVITGRPGELNVSKK